jgi:hypothetical protein
MTNPDLTRKALELPADERAELAHALLQSLDEWEEDQELAAKEWLRVAEDRYERYKLGDTPADEASVVLDRLRHQRNV